MTNSPTPSASTRIPLPSLAAGFFYTAPFLLLIGGFLGRINAERQVDWAIFQTALGNVLFWAGCGALIVGFILVGVRAIAQQHLDILLRVTSEHGVVPVADGEVP